MTLKLLSTHPADPRLSNLPPEGAGGYLSEIESMLAEGTSSIEIACPFVDESGTEVLEKAYQRSGGEATWQVFTRTAPAPLVEAAKELGWVLYEYRDPAGGGNGRGFHCKLFLVDREVAILGSTNLIHTNLVENVELGVRVEDTETLQQLAEIPRALRRTSETVVPSPR